MGEGGPGLVDWALAERTATGIGGIGSPRDRGSYDAVAIEAACAEAIEAAAAYSGLPLGDGAPAPELIDRASWARSAIATLAAAAKPLEERLADGFSLPGPIDGLVRRVLGAGAGAEAGIAVGYASRRVLGQYDVSLIGPERPARLLFVGPNLESARIELAADPALFLRWIALHETTHVLQLEGVPWLVPHLRELLEKLIEGAAGGIDPAQIGALARRLFREPRELVRGIMRGEFAQLLADPEERALLDRLQATMAVIEGHAEHVMDSCAADDPRLAELRRRLEQRRAKRGGLGEVIARLLGMELKRRQYEIGKRFWDTVVAERGADVLTEVWRSAADLPDLAEVEDPTVWLARTAPSPASR